MAISSRDEHRALDKEERELVAKTHHPDIQEMNDAELRDLAKLVRARRDRARTEAQRRKREMRGKAEPKGASASADATGSRAKQEVLATAMRRLNSEVERRRRMAARTSMVDSARRALELKEKADDDAPAHPNSRTAYKGMRAVESERRRNLIRPMELGRQRQAAKVAQAKRDNRGS